MLLQETATARPVATPGRLGAPRRPALLAVVRQLIAAVSERHRLWRDRDHLRNLPDHLLKDIGIGRSEIAFTTLYGRARDRDGNPPAG